MILDRSSWRLASETVAVAPRQIAVTRAGPAAGEAVRARDGQLAVVPRRPGGRRGGRPAAAGRLEPEDGRARALADADSRPRALEPDRVGQSRVRDQRRQQRSEGDVPARTLRRRRCVGRSLDAAVDAVRARRADREDRVGARRLRGRAARAAPHQVDLRQRHAGDGRPASSSPSFGSQGVYAYGVDGTLLWKADLGRLDVGAYDVPTFEWGTASSPIIWNDLVILQCDTQADSFLVALDAGDRPRRSGRPSARSCRRGARRRWRRRRRAPSWSPTPRTSSAATIRGPARSCGASAAARRSRRRRRLPPATCSSSPAVERPSGRSSSSRPARAAT